MQIHYIIVSISVLSTQTNLEQWFLTFSYDYYHLGSKIKPFWRISTKYRGANKLKLCVVFGTEIGVEMC